MASVKALNSMSNFNRRRFESKPELSGGNQQVSLGEPQLGTAP
jgi:hypothetical protein